MKKNVIYLIWIILICSLLTPAQQRPRDYFFMIDVSGSMVGKGDGQGINIFDDVKSWVKAYIEQMAKGEILIIYPFERGLHNSQGKYFKKVLESESDKITAKKFVDNLNATGQSTWLTDSYAKLVQNMQILNELVEGYDKSRREQIIVIYTDGKGNGPSDSNIENFIDKYKFVRNDYEHLLTKFFVIGEIDVEINLADKENLENNNIDVTVVKRNETANLVTLEVDPSSLIAYSYNPKFSIQISNVPDSLRGHLVDLQIIFDKQIPCLFEYSPKQISLENFKIYDISIELRDSEQCLRYLKENNIESFTGILNLNSKSEFIVFFPSSKIELNYLLEPINLIFYPVLFDKETDEINLGFSVEGNEYLNNKYTLKLNGNLLLRSDIEMNFEPNELTLSRDIDTFIVRLSGYGNDYSKFIDSLKYELTDSVKLSVSLIKESPDIKIDDARLKYPVTFYPITKPVLLYILLSLLVILLLAFLICYLRTARFPKGAKIEYADGSICGFLKSKFCKSYLSGGDTKKDNVKVSGLSIHESLIIIRPSTGSGIKISKSNPKIRLLNSSESESEILILHPGDKFFILHNTEKIELFYTN